MNKMTETLKKLQKEGALINVEINCDGGVRKDATIGYVDDDILIIHLIESENENLIPMASISSIFVLNRAPTPPEEGKKKELFISNKFLKRH